MHHSGGGGDKQKYIQQCESDVDIIINPPFSLENACANYQVRSLMVVPRLSRVTVIYFV